MVCSRNIVQLQLATAFSALYMSAKYLIENDVMLYYQIWKYYMHDGITDTSLKVFHKHLRSLAQ